jgi:hypothetical protein
MTRDVAMVHGASTYKLKLSASEFSNRRKFVALWRVQQGKQMRAVFVVQLSLLLVSIEVTTRLPTTTSSKIS